MLALALASLAACASSSGGSAEPVDSGLAAEDGAPATPACATVGQTICDVALQGYVSNATTGLATDKPFAPATLSAVLAAGTQKYALVFMSAFWCSTCKQAAAQVVAQYPSLAAKAMFVDVVIEGATPTTPTTKPNLDAWVAGMKNAFSTMMDVDASPFATKSTLGIKETSYVLERASGKILVKTSSPLDALTQLAALP
jgi:hypothetical protein